jgi:hypothetical protein
MRRIIYFFYYLSQLEKKKYKKFLDYLAEKEGLFRFRVNLDVLQSVFKYNISLLEYFQFRFFELNEKQRESFAGTGYMYEYQLLMNPKKERPTLEDKRLFLSYFKKFVFHKHASIEKLKEDKELVLEFLGSSSGKLVLKSHNGQCGRGVEVVDTRGLDATTLIKRLEKTGNNLVEEFIVQHKNLMMLSPSGLNTVRIFTQINSNDEVELLGSRLRITINSHVDNMAAGNIAAPIDQTTGKISGPGVYSDITKDDEFTHPVTGVTIVGFQIPFWPETLEMVKAAALSYKQCRSIGWDIAITEKGPELVEGNHDWCKLVWQLPVKQGLKPLLEMHFKELKS